MSDVPWPLMLPVVVLGVLLVVYCLVDIVRADRDLLLQKWQWALAVIILPPIGALAYVLFEKLGGVQVTGSTPDERAVDSARNASRYMRDQHPR
ncbi:PLD nuclease N-terminal domain-containing protein [Flexivirga sp. B27]